MKKLLGIFIAISALLLSACGNNTLYTSDKEITIDNMPVQGYSLNNKLMIALEDLQNYGFTVANSEDALRITTYKYQGEAQAAAEYTVAAVGVVEKSQAVMNGVAIDTYTDGNKNYASIEILGGLDGEYNKEWGYSDYNMKLTESDGKYNLECFRFDREAHETLAEMEALVSNAEFDLYTETEGESQHYGGLHEPKSGIIAGIIGDGNGNEYIGNPKIFNHGFACYSNYVDFDTKQDGLDKPGSILSKESDCVILVPWNTEDVTQVYENEKYIRQVLDGLKEYNRPVIIRYACEMNIGSRGDSPSAYIKAFRFVADIVHEYGMATMWSPNDVGSYNRPMSLYYPGDEYVDWIGISSFMKPEFMERETSRSDAILFNCADFAWHTNSVKYVLDFMQKNNISKPVAISEGAVVSSVAYEGSSLTDEWAQKRLRNMYWYLPMVYPQVKMITYFNHSTPSEKVGYDLYEKQNYIDIIEDALVNGPYLLNYSDKVKFTFEKASGKEYKNESIPLYEYVYLPEENTEWVKYYIDGKELACLYNIPYRYVLDSKTIANGEHKLTVEIKGSKNMYKQEFLLLKLDEAVVVE